MADPDESLPLTYREPLSRKGFELVTAVSGLECVARLRECVPKVLVPEPQSPWGGGDGVLAMMSEVSGRAMGSIRGTGWGLLGSACSFKRIRIT